MNAPIEAVYVHGFRNYDGGSEYCDLDDNPDGGTFDHGEEQDFLTLDAALTWAESRAALYNCPVQVY
jgi:hypothetical protein